MKYNLKTGLLKTKAKLSELKKSKDVVLVGIGGGSSAGKTYFAKMLGKKVILMDDYYKGINFMKNNNFDDPDALDLDLLKEHLNLLKNGLDIKKPIYDFKIHSRIGYETFLAYPVIVIDGLFALNKIVKNILDLKIFIESSSSQRLERRIARDINERGRSRESVLKQWNETVEPMYSKFVLKTKKYADIVILN